MNRALGLLMLATAGAWFVGVPNAVASHFGYAIGQDADGTLEIVPTHEQGWDADIGRQVTGVRNATGARQACYYHRGEVHCGYFMSEDQQAAGMGF